MNYKEGKAYILDLTHKLEKGGSDSFNVGELKINYPGKKVVGDYKLTINGDAPCHTDLVKELYDICTQDNIDNLILFLDDVYNNGLTATSSVLSKVFKEKLFWITLQEEINYPPPKKGRKLTFQRFYEGLLSKMEDDLELGEVFKRTNNFGKPPPELYEVKRYRIPSFYS